MLLAGEQCGNDGCRRGIAAFRLQDDDGIVDAHFAKLLGHQKAMPVRADDDHGRGVVELGGAQGRGLQQGVIADQLVKLLWVAFAGQGPQASAGAAGEEDGDEGGHEWELALVCDARVEDIESALTRPSGPPSPILGEGTAGLWWVLCGSGACGFDLGQEFLGIFLHQGLIGA